VREELATFARKLNREHRGLFASNPTSENAPGNS
jgi:hypothetical protein